MPADIMFEHDFYWLNLHNIDPLTANTPENVECYKSVLSNSNEWHWKIIHLLIFFVQFFQFEWFFN